MSSDRHHVLTLTELCKRWQCSRQIILAAIHRGELQAFRVGIRAYRVTLAEIERFERSSLPRV